MLNSFKILFMYKNAWEKKSNQNRGVDFFNVVRSGAENWMDAALYLHWVADEWLYLSEQVKGSSFFCI